MEPVERSDAEIATLVPHADDSRLLDRLLSLGTAQLEAEVTVRGDSAFSEPDGSLMPWIGLEIMAQAVSAYATLCGDRHDEAPRIGLLLGVRSYRCEVECFARGTRLIVRVIESTRDGQGMGVFDCWVSDGDTVVAQGMLTVFEPEDVREYLGDPTP